MCAVGHDAVFPAVGLGRRNNGFCRLIQHIKRLFKGQAPKTPEVRALTARAADCDAAGHRIIVPEIIDYEVRRELLRSHKTDGIAELDNLKTDFTYSPLKTWALLKAVELWAGTRQRGKPTSHDENIGIDVILAARALTLGLPSADIVVATANLRHLSLFVSADLWNNISP